MNKNKKYWEEIGGGCNSVLKNRQTIPWSTRVVAKVNEPSGDKISPLLDEYLKANPHLDYRLKENAELTNKKS